MGGVATEAPTRPSPAPAPATASAARYRPQLDGLRAVAVYLVVAYHAGVHGFSGGFIGVDLFFVLSGYLVTQLLLRDFRQSERIGFRRFYSRRIRRLLPAAIATLLVTAAVYTAVASPAEVVSARGGFRSAFLYVANWHFIAQSNNYFAADVNSNPVVHFWSLSVEEQFYLFWPLLLTGLYLLARRAGEYRWKVVRIVIVCGFLASLLAALHLSTVNLNRAYYGTDTRAYELLAGALLAITPRVVRSAKRHTTAMAVLGGVSIAALVLIATPHVHLGEIQRGLAATVASAALIVAVEAARTGPVTRGLSVPSAVYLGRVSYGTYLWHWPIIVIATQRFHPSPWALFALTALLATGLASLSFQVLEQRVRLSRVLDRHRTAVIAAGLAASLIGGLVLVPRITSHDLDAGVSTATAIKGVANGDDTRIPVPRGLDLERVGAEPYGRPDCYGRSVARCVVIDRGPRKVLLLGDSHAQSLIPGLAKLAKRNRFTLAIGSSPNCPWEQGMVELPLGSPPNLGAVCRAHQDDWYDRIVPGFDPDIVVLAHRTLDDPLTPSLVSFANGPRLRSNGPGFEKAAAAAVTRTVDELRARGRKIVIIEPLPTAPGAFNPFTCLTKATYLEECRYIAIGAPTVLERDFRSLADGNDVFSLNLDRVVCPYIPICDPIVAGVVVKKDPQHITAAFSRTMAPSIETLLVDDGIFSRSN